MADGLAQLYAAIAARPAGGVLGWRSGTVVDNAQFIQRVHAWHALLRAQAGANFALYLDDSVEFGAALLGAWHAGKTIWLSADTLPATIASLRGRVDGFLGQFPDALLPGDAGAAPFDADLSADCPALVVFTSGSTGAAQAIPKKLAQLASEVATLEQLFGSAAGNAAVFATVSHQHIYGLLFKVLWPLSCGRPVHALSVAYPEQLAQDLAAGPCVLVASPAHLKRLPGHLDWRGAAGMLRAVFSSGGPLAPDVAHATGKLLGQVPVEVYGSSETGGIAWRQRRADADGDDTWLPFPSVAWRLAADGALEVRSPHLADASWLTLADRAARGDHGDARRFQLLGRNDRIVKIEEKRVSLNAMEAALTGCELVAEARIVPAPHMPGERDRLAAFIVPTVAGRALRDTLGKVAMNGRLRAVLAGTVDAVALPRRWRYLDQLPVDAQGKTTVAALLAQAGDARPRFARVRALEVEARRVVLELTAPADLLYFDGHFDAAPILPGVVQVDWAMHYGRQYFALPPHFAGMHALKFQQVIVPEQPVLLELLHDSANGSLSFRYHSAAGKHASGRMLLRAGGADA